MFCSRPFISRIRKEEHPYFKDCSIDLWISGERREMSSDENKEGFLFLYYLSPFSGIWVGNSNSLLSRNVRFFRTGEVGLGVDGRVSLGGNATLGHLTFLKSEREKRQA